VARVTQLAQIISDRIHTRTGTRYAPEVIQLILDQRDSVLSAEEASDRVRGMKPVRYDPSLKRYRESTDEELDNES